MMVRERFFFLSEAEDVGFYVTTSHHLLYNPHVIKAVAIFLFLDWFRLKTFVHKHWTGKVPESMLSLEGGHAHRSVLPAPS